MRTGAIGGLLSTSLGLGGGGAALDLAAMGLREVEVRVEGFRD